MRFLFASLAVLALTSSASAAIISDLFNTGVDASGTPLPDDTINDPHYDLQPNPDGAITERVRTGAGGFPIGPWLSDDTISAWIGPANTHHDLTSAGGLYVYETTFTLPANVNLSSVLLTGQWSVDDGDANADVVKLNGVTIETGNGGFSSWTAFGAAGTGFVVGVNTLDFVGQNGGGPGGIRVEMTGDYAVVPEPGSFVMLGLGAVGLALAARRRQA